jgi:transcriptional regulator with XRE-family HTH domain
MTIRGQVATELAQLRALAGISGRRMAKEIGTSQSKISRIESADHLPSVPLVKAWLDVVAAPDDVHPRIISMIEAAHTETVAYRSGLRGKRHLQDDIYDQEAKTIRFCGLESAIVPGLLQTRDYAVAVMALADTEGLIDQDAALAGRLRRQEILGAEGRTFSYLLFEQILSSPIMTETQLHRLAELAERGGNIEVGIVPTAASWPAVPWHGFRLETMRDGTRMVAAELTHGESVVTSEDDLKLYERVYQTWRDVAVFGPEAAVLCRAAATSGPG